MAEYKSESILENVTNMAISYAKSPQVAELEAKRAEIAAQLEQAKMMQPQIADLLKSLKEKELTEFSSFKDTFIKFWLDNFDHNTIPPHLFKVETDKAS
jgi:hypothetical protein